MREPVKVLVVDNHPIVRAGVIDLLRTHNCLKVIGEATNGKEALVKARELQPDVALVDINLPKLNGLQLIKSLRDKQPGIKVLVLSMQEPELLADQIIQSGALGFVNKRAASTELVTALETVAGGGTFFGSHFTEIMMRSFSREAQSQRLPLSQREREVLTGIAEGLTNREVAARLHIGVRTVDTHRERIVRKLNIRSTQSAAGLTRFAIQHGLVS